MSKVYEQRKINRKRGGDVGIFLILLIFGAFMALPFIYAILQSFKPLDEIFIFPPKFFVVNPTTENYTQLIRLASNSWVPFLRYLFNSVMVSIVATVGHVLLASMAAFPLAKLHFPGDKIVFSIIVTSLLFTADVLALPSYLVMAKLHLIDTYMALIFPAFGSSLGLFLMRQFMVGLPDSLIEASKVDGAKTIVIYWRIIMPNIKPAWLTCVIFAVQSIWNNGGTQFLYDEALKTLPTMLSQISAGGIARVGVGAAASVVLMIPPILVFVFSQSQVLETMSHSGMKE